jgi:hypothetical protein
MKFLDKDLRKQLEKSIIKARNIAETGARSALERLAVGQAEPFKHMSPEERELRVWLRARGRQLGDILEGKTQVIDHLVSELSYEYWHKMLFARFLAENNLLIHPEGVPVSLAECDELANELKEENLDGWTLASRYASQMLPQIFRPGDRLLQIPFAPEHKLELEKLLSSLTTEVFTSDDSLGWCYQYWQSERKEQVNQSGDKINADTLPAVTQLFTEHYMVEFLLHNTIGAWWVEKLKGEGKIPKEAWAKCQTEDDCRKLVSLPGYEFTYLRFIKNPTGEWFPAAGAFPGWPKSLKEFKLLDPCCGSGHFLVAAFLLLMLLRMYEEKLSAQDACDSVIRENLFGLEIDLRCTQIAAFALALAAWTFPDAGGYRSLPRMKIACCGIAPHGKKEDWVKLANGDTRLSMGMNRLYDLFQQAPDLGSLIEPHNGDLIFAEFTHLHPLLERALQSDKVQKDFDLAAAGVAALGIAGAAQLLTGKYHLVITNVPYLKGSKHSDTLKKFCAQHYPDAKADLATVFVTRSLQLCVLYGTAAMVTTQYWLFLNSYKKLRQRILNTKSWNLVALLGPGAFETISGEVVNVALSVISNQDVYHNNHMIGIDVSGTELPSEKAELLKTAPLHARFQSSFLSNPDSRIVLDDLGKGPLLEKYVDVSTGLQTGDNLHYIRFFWEFSQLLPGWEYQQRTANSSIVFGGREQIIFWEEGKGALSKEPQAVFRGLSFRGKSGVAVNRMGNLAATLYTGELLDQNAAIIVPKESEYWGALWAFCSSKKYSEAVRRIDKKFNVTPATLVKVPFDLQLWTKLAKEAGPLPKPYSDDPTQWLFKGNIVESIAPLQVAVERLLGYRWPNQPQDGLDQFADEDGILCIPAVRGEKTAADRLREILVATYGIEWSPAKQEELLAGVEFGGRTLEDWLRNGFFEQHCKLFHQRAFIWHIWDGRKDGFSALVNYHKLDRQNLEKLTYTYVGDWIKRQEGGLARDEDGAEPRLLAARQLQEKLKLILEGEAPYDIFVRWKPIEKQPIGWEPDLNDGVRLNIRPFVEADILRKRPNINWNKDRGKNPPGSPWGEERINDRHLTLKEKREAREKIKKR